MGSEQLDEALAAYSRVEPRVGIEGRILANVALARRRRKWMAAGWSLSTVAVLCIIGLLVWPAPTMTIAPLPIHAEALPPPPQRQWPAEPAPLTREERAWMTLGESGILARVEPAGIEPLQIEELTIPPLESEGGE
jgi:hypothetical protein